MEILEYYQSAQVAGLKPTLLEFQHPLKKTPLLICGIAPNYNVHVKHGNLYKDEHKIGHALDIFDHLTLSSCQHFFPAFLGFFSYEFSRYFGLATHQGQQIFPEAFFSRYEKGLVIDDGEIIHHDPILMKKLSISPLNMQHINAGMNKDNFLDAVSSIKNTIKNGDVYQVNLSLPFYFSKNTHALSLYQSMRTCNPSPFMGLMEHDDWSIICGSPERLFSLNKGILGTRPIAGTKKRCEDNVLDNAHMNELKNCPKENAEHVMLVDLLRNDMHKVCPEQVIVTEDRSVEFYSHVMHLVSQINGHSQSSLKDIIHALFPGGTITGAPKANVMASIAALETQPRGPYTGTLGYISSGFGSDFNILIRSVLRAHKRMFINSGAGIVIDSNPEHEWEEVNRKAEFIKDILLKQTLKKHRRACIVGPCLKPAKNLKQFKAKKVLFIENNDSFGFNIIALLRSLGVNVRVSSPNTSLILDDYTHALVGPGPGNPSKNHNLLEQISAILHRQIPALGICLGHQAIAHYFGATICKLPPLHGQRVAITHHQKRLFKGLNSPTFFTRYHSLAVKQAPANFIIDAYSDDDCIMAISHKTLPIFGVQFHPESYLSENSHTILENFLEYSWPT
ncbi:MAG: chorismate-binding protein [Myxococcales bacterium]|nr:chorismate-binding protein [Myxococcales bacterium]USN50972.1 MAG: chorismate-binding protein [Myxococcales bacterium]